MYEMHYYANEICKYCFDNQFNISRMLSIHTIGLDPTWTYDIYLRKEQFLLSEGFIIYKINKIF